MQPASTGPMPPLPNYDNSTPVVEPPAGGPGNWAGGPSAVRGPDGAIYLAYRLRRPVGRGHGYANVVARSEDGEHFEVVSVLDRNAFDCASLERPALVVLPDGRWRIYATGSPQHLRATGDGPISGSPFGSGSLRYLSVVYLEGG